MSAPQFTRIPGWSGYAASRDGLIASIEHNWRGYGERELTQELNRYFYPCVRLTMGDGTRKRFTVHKLVALTFLGPCPSDCDQMRHLNGDRSDNRVENLAWGTAASNAADRTAHGTAAPMTPEKKAKMAEGRRRYIEERKARDAA